MNNIYYFCTNKELTRINAKLGATFLSIKKQSVVLQMNSSGRPDEQVES